MARWRVWVAVVAIVVAGCGQGGTAFAAERPTPALGTAISDLTKWLGGGAGSNSVPPIGTARDVRYTQPKAGHPHGRKPGKGKGQLPVATGVPGLKNSRSLSGFAHRGFNAKTSKRDAALSGAQFDYFKNADGSITRQVSQDRLNFKDADGTWQHIDTNLAHGADGRYHEKANSLAVSFAATSRNAPMTSAAPRAATSRAAVADQPADLPATGPLASLTISPTQSVSWSLAGAAQVPATVDGDTAEYDGVLPDTDLQVRPTDDGVKESIILDSASAPTSWTFPLDVQGLTVQTADDGTINLVDGSGTVVAALPKAYAYDSYVDPVSGERHENHTMSYAIVQTADGPELTMSLDPQWLSDLSTVFPVTVDPTVVVSIAGETETTYVEYPYDEDFSDSSVLKTGTYDAGAHIGQAFMKFPTMPDTDGYQITAASLSMFDIWSSYCGGSESWSVYPIASSWSVTGSKSWSDRPGTASSIGTWSGTASSSTCSNSSLDTSTGQTQTVSLSTTTFQNIALGASNNYGLSIFSSGTDSNTWKQFDSSQVSSHSPKLSITYTPNSAPDIEHTYPQNGFEPTTLTPELQAVAVDPDTWPNAALSYNFGLYNSSGTLVKSSGSQSSPNWRVPSGQLAWSKAAYWNVSVYDGWSTTTSATNTMTPQVSQPLIASHLAQNSGHGYSDLVGNYTTSATDASIATVGPGLAVARSYNSLDTRTSQAFGSGWSSLADVRATVDDDGSQNVVITDADGHQSRFGYASSGFSAPLGSSDKLTTATGGGYVLVDSSGTTYTLTTGGGTNVYLLTSITTHAGLTETYTYDASHQLIQVQSASGRALHFAWSPPSGTFSAHVHTVTTDDATSGDATTASVWTYGYTGDRLTSVCPPSPTAPSSPSTACTTYTYQDGSDYPAADLDADPNAYWRLDDADGATAVSSVLANEQTDDGTYKNATVAATGPLAGAAATAVTFSGNGYVKVPSSQMHISTSRAVSLWFKTSQPGVLIGDQTAPVDGATSASGSWTPVLYVGSDGKLRGHWWSVTGSDTVNFGSASTVTDNAWHHAVLSSDGTTQTMYLDGVKQGTFSGTPDDKTRGLTYIGAGFAQHWFDEPADVSYFTGSMADVAFYDHPVSATQVSELYGDGTKAAAFLTGETTPAGHTVSQVAYDTDADRVTSVTDDNGGTWQVGTPQVEGSSQVYDGAVLGAGPAGYWQLGDDDGATIAVDEIDSGDATYNDATLGVDGPFSAKDSSAGTAASFNGTDSYVSVPPDLLHQDTKRAVSLWFKTSTPGVLIADQTDPVDGATSASDSWTPVLYVGSDGKLRGHWFSVTGSDTVDFGSTSTVTNNAWHHAVLSSDGTTQTMYLDGVKQGTFSGAPVDGNRVNTYIGAGFAQHWFDEPADVSYFKGSIAEVAFYQHALTAAQVSAQWNAYKQSSGTVATETVNDTDPAQNTVSATYDLSAGGRALSETDATGATTSYGYDTSGFLYTVTDPDGEVTTTGHDANGNEVSATTCQSQASSICSTSYFTYYYNSSSLTDPRNDEMLTSSDGRSSSASDTTYRTSYTYDTNGNLLTTTKPNAGSTSVAATNTYTTATTAGYVAGTTVPAGLLATATTPGGALTSYTYYADGDLALKTSPLGLKTYYTYDGLGRVATEREVSDSFPAGLTTTFTYDAQGRVLTETDPGTTDAVDATVHTARTTTTYDADGNVLSTAVSDTTGGDQTRTTTNTYNSLGQLTTVTDPAGVVVDYTYDALGNTATKTDVLGQDYQYGYDADSRLTSTTLTNYTGSTATPATPTAQVLENRTYYDDGRLKTVTNAIGVTRSYAYYDNGLTQQVTDTGSQGTTSIEEQDTYDAASNLTARTTANGTLTTDYTVDPQDRTTVTTVDPSAADQVTTVTYDQDSDVLSSLTTDAANDPELHRTYTYDAAGDVKSQQQDLGYPNTTTHLTTSWTYDQRGLALTMTDPDQELYQYVNDEAGRRVSTTAPAITTTNPDGTTATVAPTTLVGYDTFGDVTANEDPRGNITTTAYDHDGRRTATTLPAYTAPGAGTPLLSTTSWTYDNAGDLLTETDGNGAQTSAIYDQLGDAVSRTNPPISVGGTMTSGTWSYTYDLGGNQLTSTSPYGAVVHSTTDDLGRPATTYSNVHLTSAATSLVKTTDAYNTAGELSSATSVTGVTQKYGYDHLGNRTSVADTDNEATTNTYDLLGDVTSTTNPDNSKSLTGYDAAGRPVSTTDEAPNGTVLRTTSATYDDDGNLLSTKDAENVTKTFTYDALGDLIKQLEPTSATHSIETDYGYDADGNQTAYESGDQTGSGGGARTYTSYTPWNLPETKEVPAVGTYTTAADRDTTTSYDADGRPVREVQPGGVTVTDSFDALGDLTAQSGTGADAATDNLTFGYSLNQDLLSSSSGSRSETYDPNALGEVLSTSGAAGSSSFTYTPDGDLATRTDASGTSTYTYDDDGRPETDTDASTGTQLTYGYNADSQLQHITYGTSGNVRTFGYDALHHLSSDTLATASGTTIGSIAYTTDVDDRLTGKTTTGFAGASQNTYGYDQAGRLTSWITTPSGGTATTTAYTYDDDGNRLTAGSTSYHYDARDELTSDGTNTYAYTARGTMTSKTPTAGGTATLYSFDAYGRQLSAGSTSSTYDALGRAITSGSTTLAYSGEDNTVASDGTDVYSRDSSGGLVGEKNPGTGSATLAWSDEHTDVVGQFTATGTALTGSASYDPWGAPTASSGSTGGLGYQGEYTDPTNGAVNMAARWYNPSTGTFASADTRSNPAVGDSANANPFTYGNDDPLLEIDPTGHDGAAAWSAVEWMGGAEAADSVMDWNPVGWVAAGGILAGGLTAAGYELFQNSHTASHSGSSAVAAGHSVGNPYAACGDVWSMACAARYTSDADSSPSRSGRATSSDVGGGGGGGGGGGVSAAAARQAAIRAHALQITASIGHAALTVGATAAGVFRPSTQINIGAAVGNAAAAVVAAGVTAAVCVVTGGCTPHDDDDEDTTCTADGQGWVDYGQMDSAHGDRATGVTSCLNSDYVEAHPGSATQTRAGTVPPGYQWARKYAWHVGGFGSDINACHLLGKQLGGSGTDLRNLATCGSDANSYVGKSQNPIESMDSMLHFEDRVMDEIDAGNTVLYRVKPLYSGDRTVPHAFLMSYTAWNSEGEILPGGYDEIPNILNTRGGGHKNIGQVIDDRTGRDVPLPGQ